MQEQVRQQLLGELPSHRARVYSVCRQRLRWHPDAYELAHDMTQEVMLKASRKIDSFRGGARLSTWLMQIAIKDRKSTRLNSSHQIISYAVFCLKKKKK